MENLLVHIEEHNGVLVTTSNRVAQELGVQHKHLLEKIDGYVNKFNSAELSAQFYIPHNYKDKSGKINRNYLITQKGVAQLIGGYNAAVPIAFALNVAYINEFERMREFIKENKSEISRKDMLKLNIINADTEMDRMVALNQYQVEYVKPLEVKAEYTDNVLKSESLLTITQIAKDVSMTGRELNKLLNGLGIQYKQGKIWHLTKKYQDCGYAKSYTTVLSNGNTVHNLKWTEKGRKFIIDLLYEKNLIK